MVAEKVTTNSPRALQSTPDAVNQDTKRTAEVLSGRGAPASPLCEFRKSNNLRWSFRRDRRCWLL
jgi:hypothetical protein